MKRREDPPLQEEWTALHLAAVKGHTEARFLSLVFTKCDTFRAFFLGVFVEEQGLKGTPTACWVHPFLLRKGYFLFLVFVTPVQANLKVSLLLVGLNADMNGPQSGVRQNEFPVRHSCLFVHLISCLVFGESWETAEQRALGEGSMDQKLCMP